MTKDYWIFSVSLTHSWLFGVMVMMAGWWSVGCDSKPCKDILNFEFFCHLISWMSFKQKSGCIRGCVCLGVVSLGWSAQGKVCLPRGVSAWGCAFPGPRGRHPPDAEAYIPLSIAFWYTRHPSPIPPPPRTEFLKHACEEGCKKEKHNHHCYFNCARPKT